MMVLQVEGVHKRWSSAMYRDPTGTVMVMFVRTSCDNGAVAVTRVVSIANKMQMGMIRIKVHRAGRPRMEAMFTEQLWDT